jgi:multidrug transporter EmrE-like cation transporter
MAFVSNFKFLWDIIVLSSVEFIGDSSFKKYATTDSKNVLMVGIIAYMIVIYLLIKILKYANVMHTNITWDAVSLLIESLLAYLLLKESLSGPFQIIGFILIVIGLAFMGMAKYMYK